MNAGTTTIRVYVRKVDDQRRRVSFNTPPSVPVADLLNMGYAVDGNECVFVVGGSDALDLVTALLSAERELVRYLSDHGYDAEFR